MPFDQVNFVLPAVDTDEVLRCLSGAKALLSDPARWLKCELALDQEGARVAPESRAAVSFCALGAIHHADFDHRAWRALTDASPEKNIPVYNNAPTTTHADLMAWFDRAIAARRAEIGG